MPEQDKSLLGTISVKNLIGADVTLRYDGITVRAKGTVNSITAPWEEFDQSGKNTGHFFPIELPAKCVEQTVKCKGRVDGDREVRIDEDRLLVIRMENLAGTIAEFEMNGETIMKLDLSGLVPVGEKAYDAGKKDFGGYGQLDDLVHDFSITWDGIKGIIKGEFQKTTTTKLKTPGHYLPIGMSSWYFDGVPKKAGTETMKAVKDKDIVFTVTDPQKPARIEYNGMTVMELDLSGTTMAP